MRWERKGSSRDVFIIGRWVVKIPKVYSWETFLWGLLSNIQEREFSNLEWPELCPVIWSIPGGFLLVMPNCSIIERENFSESIVNEIINNANKSGRTIPAEIKHDSWGYYKNRLVAVDYG